MNLILSVYHPVPLHLCYSHFSVLPIKFIESFVRLPINLIPFCFAVPYGIFPPLFYLVIICWSTYCPIYRPQSSFGRTIDILLRSSSRIALILRTHSKQRASFPPLSLSVYKFGLAVLSVQGIFLYFFPNVKFAFSCLLRRIII